MTITTVTESQVPDGRKRFSMGREITKNPIIIVWTGLGTAHFSRKGVTFLEKIVIFVKKNDLRGMGTTKVSNRPEKSCYFEKCNG